MSSSNNYAQNNQNSYDDVQKANIDVGGTYGMAKGAENDLRKNASMASGVYFMAKGAETFKEGLEDKDYKKVGEGLASAGFAGVASSSVLAPAAASAVGGVLGATAGATVAAAFLPVTAAIGIVGAGIWLFNRNK